MLDRSMRWTVSTLLIEKKKLHQQLCNRDQNVLNMFKKSHVKFQKDWQRLRPPLLTCKN